MHAIILAAGRGKRLEGYNPEGHPKCLMEFGGRSLLERHLDLLYRFGVRNADLVVGFEADRIIAHVATLRSRPDVAYPFGPLSFSGLDSIPDSLLVANMRTDVPGHSG